MLRIAALVCLLVPALAQDDASRLVEACFEGDAARARALLDGGADANAAGAEGVTPLMAAAADGHVDVVRLLLARGADVDGRNRGGATALFVAAGARRAPPEGLVDFYFYMVRRVEVVRLLLAAGADPNGPADGPLPLVAALEAGLLPIAEALLRAGASFDREFAGATLGAVAVRETMKDDEEMLDFVLRHGAKPDREALWKAVEDNRIAVATVTLVHAAERGRFRNDFDRRRYLGMVAYFWAAFQLYGAP